MHCMHCMVIQIHFASIISVSDFQCVHTEHIRGLSGIVMTMHARIEYRTQAASLTILASVVLMYVVVAIAAPLPSIALPTPRKSVPETSVVETDNKNASDINTPSLPTHPQTLWWPSGPPGHGSLVLIAPMGSSKGQLVLPAKVTPLMNTLEFTLLARHGAVFDKLSQNITF